MPARDIAAENEIWLGDTYFPIKGPVRLANITVSPNPVLFGDANLSGDSQVMAQFGQSNTRGGCGLYKANVRTQADRNWYCSLDDRFDYFTLPPLAHDLTRPGAAAATDAYNILMVYRGLLYASLGGIVYSYTPDASDDAVGVWSAALRTLTAAPTDWKVFQDRLFIACTSGLEALNGAAWDAAQAIEALYLEIFDSKLYRIGYTSATQTYTLYVSATGLAASWTAKATIPNTTHAVTDLKVWRTPAGALALYAITDAGAWLYDATNDTWTLSEIAYPKTSNAGKKSLVDPGSGKLLIKTGGLGLLSVQSGDVFQIQPIGKDRDDGCPDFNGGSFVAMDADPNWVYVAQNADGYLNSSNTSSTGSNKLNYIIWAWRNGWHQIFSRREGESSSTTTNRTVTDILIVEGSGGPSRKRLYWCEGDNSGSLVMQTLDPAFYNPRVNTSRLYHDDIGVQQGRKRLRTPFYDFGSSINKKVIPHVLVQVSGYGTVGLNASYYKDFSETATSLGTITADGLTTLKIDSGRGDNARFFSFEFTILGASGGTEHPKIEFWTAEHLRLLPATYGFACEIDLTKPHREQSPYQMYRDLLRLCDPAQTSNLIEFAFQDDLSGDAQTYLVRPMRMAGGVWGGRKRRGEGSFLLSLVAPYTEDTL